MIRTAASNHSPRERRKTSRSQRVHQDGLWWATEGEVDRPETIILIGLLHRSSGGDPWPLLAHMRQSVGVAVVPTNHPHRRPIRRVMNSIIAPDGRVIVLLKTANRTRRQASTKMPNVISIHEHTLKPEVLPQQFEEAVRLAQRRGLLRLPGLIEYRFIRGIKGSRAGQYSAIWIYESRNGWEALWGPVDRPKPKSQYPANWRAWEDEVLAPLLTQDSDTITFCSYEDLPGLTSVFQANS